MCNLHNSPKTVGNKANPLEIYGEMCDNRIAGNNAKTGEHKHGDDIMDNIDNTCAEFPRTYYEAYLGEKEASRCLHEWRGGRVRFDPLAFLFSFFWLFRKGLYREFTVLLAVSAVLPLAVGLTAGIISIRSDRRYKDEDLSPAFVAEQLSEPAIVYWLGGSGCLQDHGGFYIDNDHSFRFRIARLGTLTAINIFCGLSFGRLYKRKTETEILKQISLIKTDDKAARENILRKAGRELKRPDIGNVFVFILWAALVSAPFLQMVCEPLLLYFYVKSV